MTKNAICRVFTSMNIKHSLAEASRSLRTNNIDYADLEAELLICHVLSKPREFILAYPELSLNAYQNRVLQKLINRRINHEPLSYILGHQSFYNIELAVNKNVLIPRPETEVLVELVLGSSIKEHATIIDIGTGSGAIILSLAKNMSGDHTFIATDLSAKALLTAKSNAKKNNINNKVTFLKSNLLKKMLKRKSWPFSTDLVLVTNLPYLSNDWEKELTTRQKEELKKEPGLALFAGIDGFDLYRQLAEEIKNLIKKFNLKIILFCEISPEQANLFSHTFSELGQVSLERDLTGKIRVGIVR